LKFPFLLNDEEDEIKEKLLRILKQACSSLVNPPSNHTPPTILKNILTSLENFEIFYMKTDKSVLTTDEFIDHISIDNIFLFSQNYSQNLILQEIAKYPLTKYVGVLRSPKKRKLEFSIYPYHFKNEHESYRILSLILFDINNNPMLKIFISLPIMLKSCSDLIDHIYQSVLCRFYKMGTTNIVDFNKNNFYFIIQHGFGTFAYDIFIDSNDYLLKYDYENNLSIQYRLQIFTDDEIDTFTDDERIRIFVAFITKEGNPACHPLIVYIKNNSTVLEIKNLLIEKLKKINKLHVYGDINLSKVKFYTYSLENYKPVKDVLLINSKDEEQIIHFFKGKNGRPCNLLVEFLNNGNNNFINSSCFLENIPTLNFFQ
jgi:hypothetical protein